MTSRVLNVTIDSADPQAQARFWSDVTGQPAIDESRPGNPFWLVAPHPDQEGPRLVFVPVTQAKLEKNRIHVDIVPTNCSQADELKRLLTLGASVVEDRRRTEGGGWVVLADPEGNEFCLEGE